MDLVYIPDVLSFGSFRSPQSLRSYEQSWNNNYYDEDRSPAYHNQREKQQQHHHHQQQQQQRDASSSKDSCHMCRENKRRSLAAYIRGKGRDRSCSEICEVDEEEEEVTGPQPRNSKNPGCSKPLKPSAEA